ncbi:hypothetical protein Tco_0872603 [Tanacetum coccineum]
MVQFSDNMEIPSHARVHMLELMQFITDSSTSSTLFSTELQVNVFPWDGWDNIGNINSNRKTRADNEDAPNRFTHTLIALKSSQLLSNISPNLKITPNDLSTLDSAVSCFFKQSEYAVLQAHIDVLIYLMIRAMMIGMKDEKASRQESVSERTWSNCYIEGASHDLVVHVTQVD